jgi:hypothetical protein
MGSTFLDQNMPKYKKCKSVDHFRTFGFKMKKLNSWVWN